MDICACRVTTLSLPGRAVSLWKISGKGHAPAFSRMGPRGVLRAHNPVLGVKFSSSSGSNITASQGGIEDFTSIDNGDIIERDSWKWSMVVSYDGTKYSGWQIQPKNITVQKTIEDALCQIIRCSREELAVTAAGRTDAGVHAWGQVVHFCTPFVFKTLESIHSSLNAILPQDVRIRQIRAVQPAFHARYSARRKTYTYKAYVGPVMDPFQRSYAYFFPYDIDVVSMREAASLLIGEHNFSAFANTSPRVIGNPVRKISKFSVELAGPQLLFEVEGSGFFYKQVRNMVGLLLEIGRGTIPVRSVSHVLGSQKRKVLAKYASTAPAHGLYLMTVEYDEALFYPPDSVPKASYGYREIYYQQARSVDELTCSPTSTK